MFRKLIKDEIAKIVPEGTSFSVEIPEISEHGDYASNVAMVLAKKEGKNPREVAEELKNKVAPRLCSGRFSPLEKIEIAGPGFLNFFISQSGAIEYFKNILKNSKIKNWVKIENPQKINLEFVSANPTGPLTMANGRGGFYGDVLANVLSEVGHSVVKEYYINDAGNQIKLLGESISASEGKIPEKEEYYKGEYIKELKGKSAEEAVRFLLGKIKKSLENAGIKFDVWFSEEENLHKKNELEKTLYILKQKEALEERDGALWLADHVLIKTDKTPTYFLADLSYHYDKFIKRGFDLAINIWGADHHGYIERMKRGVEALGVNPERLKIIMMQLVKLVSGGQEVKMSKRAGEFVTMDELLEMVGLDAARWFFLERTPNTQMDFDLDLAKERSKKNPVYYVQYAHARACSVGRTHRFWFSRADLTLLKEREEFNLIKKILQFYEVIEDTSNDYYVHRLTNYVYGLAQTYTSFYENHRIILEDKKLSHARMKLNETAKIIIKKSLNLLGIDAPEKM